MTKQQIYTTIVSITAEIKTTGVGLKLYEAAKSDGQKVKEICETFMAEHPELYQKMCSFATEFKKLIEEIETYEEVEVFGLEKDEEKGIFVFDLNEINATSYFVFTFLTRIDDSYLFTEEYFDVDSDEGADKYYDAIEEESGSYDLAEFVANALFDDEEFEYLEEHGFKYSNTYDLLADIFAGKLKEYVA